MTDILAQVNKTKTVVTVSFMKKTSYDVLTSLRTLLETKYVIRDHYSFRRFSYTPERVNILHKNCKFVNSNFVTENSLYNLLNDGIDVIINHVHNNLTSTTNGQAVTTR